MTNDRFLAAVKAAVIGVACATIAAACSGGGGGGTTGPSQPVGFTPAQTTASSPPAATSGVPASPPPGAAAASSPAATIVSATSTKLAAALVPPIPAGGQQAYSDTFESDLVGRAPTGWNDATGTWSVCQPPSMSHELCAASNDGGVALAGNKAWTNYYVDAIAVDSNFTYGGIAVLGRVQDATHFYQLELRRDIAGSSTPMWYIWKYDGQTWTEIAGGAFTAQNTPYYRLRLAFNGNVISAFIAYNYTSNFQALGAGTDASYATGQVGLRSWATNAARFDDVAVTLLANGAGPSPTTKPTSAPPPPAPVPPAPLPNGGYATYRGCPVFTAGDWYNNDISRAPVALNSAAQIAATNDRSSHEPLVFSIGIERLNLANNSTPTHAVVKPSGVGGYWHSAQFANVSWPWQNGYYIEGVTQSGGGGGGDNHGLVLNTDTCHLYETYWTWWSGNALGAYSGGNWDLTHQFVGFAPSSMASGLSLFAGAIKWEYDLANGSINHALNFYVPQGAQGPGVSLPAVSSGSSGPSGIDYGAHLRLHASFPESGTTQMIAVIRALKKYGMYMADTSSPGGQTGFYTITPLDGNNGHYDFGGRSGFTLADFDVIPPSVK